MTRKCIIPTCKIQTDDPGCNKLHFRKFPKRDEYRRAWIATLKDQFDHDTVDQILLHKNIFVCDLHFTDNSFFSTGNSSRLLLKRECIPSIFINYKSSAPKTITEKYEKIYNLIKNNGATSLIENDSLNNSDTAYETIVEPITLYKSFEDLHLDSVDYTNISEIKRILMKAQFEVESQERTIKKQRKQMKLLRNQLYRYKTKVKHFKTIMVHMKKRKKIREKVSAMLKMSNAECIN